MATQLSTKNLLEMWGLRTTGSTLKSAGLRPTAGGEFGCDEGAAIVAYVEHVPGFERARPVLIHLFGHGLPIETFRVRGPGEQYSRALIERGWFDLIGLKEAQVSQRIAEEFEDALAKQMRIAPYVPPEPVKIPDPIEMGAEATGEIIAELSRFGLSRDGTRKPVKARV